MRGRERAGIRFAAAGCILLAALGCRAQSPSKPAWTNFEMNANVFSLAFEGNDVWVGTEKGLIRYDLAQDRIVGRHDARSGLPADVVTVVRIDAQGDKWIGTHGGGLARFDGKNWRHYRPPDLADPYVYDILFDRDGRMWVANWKGVSIFDGQSWRSLTKADGIVDDWVYALAQDRDGAVWLGTEGGVSRYDGKAFVSYSHKDGLGADRTVIGDYEKIANPSFHHRTTEGKEAEGYNPNYVLAAAVDSQNRKWFGTWGAGLSSFDGRKWTSYTTRDGLAGNFISDILIDRDGTLYAATEGGVSRLSKGRWTSYTTADGLVDDGVFSVGLDPGGRKWFGTLKGISKLEDFSTQ